MACCTCGSTPVPDSCRVSITSADIAELLYIQGLDENLCTKWQEVVDIVGFVDCLGAPILPGAQIVTCAQFPARLCAAIATWAAGAVAVPGVTQLLGDDCLTHVLPIAETACAQIQAFPSGPAITLGVTEVVTENCQLAVVPETPIVVVDTLTVDLTSSGAFGHTLQADVNISEVVGNCLVVQPDGLYVPCPDAPVDFTVVGSESDCIDVTVIEAPAGTFTVGAEIVLSPNADNALSCVGNGLFVNEVTLIAGDGDCVDVQVTDLGNGDWEIVADATISPDFGNALECRENGLYANQVGLVASDSDCIALVLVGDTLTAEPIISPAPGNSLTCTAAGLFVPEGANVNVVALDTATVDMTVTEAPAGTFTVSADVEISSAPGNTIIINGDGIYSSPGAGIVPVDTNCINLTLAGANLSADPILASIYPGYPVAGSNSLECTATGLTAPPDILTLYAVDTDSPPDGTIADDGVPVVVSTVTASITNTSLYRNMLVIVDFTSPQLALSTPATSPGTFVVLSTDLNATFPEGPIAQAVYDISITGVSLPGTAVITGGAPLIFSPALSTIAPGETITITLTISITNNGDQPEDYGLGNTGVRLVGISI